MDEVIRDAQTAIALGHAALQKGLWELGLARYSYALGIVNALFGLSQTGQIELTQQEDTFLASLSMELEESIGKIKDEWGNGHRHKNPPNRGLAIAADAMLEEITLVE